MSVSWVNVDKEVGILPLNWLPERKLWKYKPPCHFAQFVGRDSITQVGNTYRFCKVTGKLDGILPPMWLLLRRLPQKHKANSKDDAEEIYKDDHWNSWTEEMQNTCRHTLTHGLAQAMHICLGT